MEQIINDLHEFFKGSRVVDGRLRIKDFDDAQYEDLFFACVEMLKPYIGDDYEKWYKRTTLSYHRFKVSNARDHSLYDPHFEKDMLDQDLQEQLAVIKYFVGRRKHSGYNKKER
jgi:hypothetical protein